MELVQIIGRLIFCFKFFIMFLHSVNSFFSVFTFDKFCLSWLNCNKLGRENKGKIKSFIRSKEIADILNKNFKYFFKIKIKKQILCKNTINDILFLIITLYQITFSEKQLVEFIVIVLSHDTENLFGNRLRSSGHMRSSVLDLYSRCLCYIYVTVRSWNWKFCEFPKHVSSFMKTTL